MNFCSNCGSEQLVFKVPEGDTYKRFICGNCKTIHYQNPRIIVGCLATWEDKILICKRNIEPRFGLWNLPAGFMENGEKAEDGALRETFEESRAEVDIIKLHAVFSLPNVNQVYLHFYGRLKEPKFSITPESSEVRLFTIDEIPWDQIAFHSTTFALEKYIEFGPDYSGVHIGSYEKKKRWVN
mgnify:CR=1 FL=1